MSPTSENDRHGAAASAPHRIGVVGRGRLGRALADALRGAGFEVDGPAGRDRVPRGDALILCVPDGEIPVAAAAIAGTAPLVGHTSGATALGALDAAAEAGAATFALHPLQSFPGSPDDADRFAGAGCAVAGSTPAAERAAAAIAERLGMVPHPIDDAQRAAYHAAASVASNFLVTLEDAGESLAAAAGIAPAEARRLLGPLVRGTVESWLSLGPERALTGPVARGDEATVAAQREAVAKADPRLLPLFDALVERTRELAARAGGVRRAEAART